ncbi:MAG: hypothetical protein Sapg2KO_04120 [Saprospiraceae bacterium]
MVKYPIGALAFGDITEENDLKGSFRIGYNATQKAIYLGVEIVDSDIIHTNPSNNIDLTDHMYLYIDPIHSPDGGSRILFISGPKLRDIATPHSKTGSPYTPNLSWKNVALKVSQNKSTTTYEWKINLGENFKVNSVIGLDIILVDADSKDQGETWMLWKQGTGKSDGSQRLGEVLLAAPHKELGTLKGQVVIKEARVQAFSSLIIQSLDNPAFWLRTTVDQKGNYQCQLPAGKYEIKPDLLFTSPRASAGFNQNSRKIMLEAPPFIEVKASTLTTTPALKVITKPLPVDLFEAEGILYQSSFSENQVDQFVKYFKEYFEIPGISIAIIKDKKVVYDKAFGLANNLTNQALNKKSVFEAASITKSVFALMVLKLVESGNLDLDKPLYQYLRFPNMEHDERYKLITARHILNHQSGLTNWSANSYTGSLSDAKADILYDPGNTFEYSGEAMNYLGRIIEQITQKPLKQLFQEEIVPAFNLENTFFSYNESLEDRMALGHWHTYPRYKAKFPNVDSPASSLYSAASDFSQFLLGLLNEVYLSKESYRMISEIYQPIPKEKALYDPSLKQGVGYGFFVTELAQGKMIAHGGNNGDYDCKYSIMPEKGLGYVVFTNSNLGDEFIRLMELFLFRGKASFEKEINKN